MLRPSLTLKHTSDSWQTLIKVYCCQWHWLPSWSRIYELLIFIFLCQTFWLSAALSALASAPLQFLTGRQFPDSERWSVNAASSVQCKHTYASPSVFWASWCDLNLAKLFAHFLQAWSNWSLGSFWTLESMPAHWPCCLLSTLLELWGIHIWAILHSWNAHQALMQAVNQSEQIYDFAVNWRRGICCVVFAWQRIPAGAATPHLISRRQN